MYSYYDYGYSTSSAASSAGAAAAVAAVFGMMMLPSLIISVVTIIAHWKIFTKSGREGWKSIIPFLNIYTLFEIVGMEGWKFLLLLIPFYNIYLAIKVNIDLAKAFGKDGGFAVGLIFLNTIFLCILAFGKAEYQLGGAPAAAAPAANGQAPAAPAAPAPKPEVGDDWVNGQQ